MSALSVLRRRIIPRSPLRAVSLRHSTNISSATRKPLYLYANVVFPIRFGIWDPRYLLAQVEKESLLAKLKTLIPDDLGHGVVIENVESRDKDGGAFVKLSYIPDDAPAGMPSESTAQDILDSINKYTEAFNTKPWWSWSPSRFFLVEGHPWLEDMLSRFPSSTIKIDYDQEIPQETLYDIFRPYGRIRDIIPSSKSANVIFTSVRSATAARNCLHGAVKNGVRLRILYQEKQRAHVIRDWASNHPKIMLPLLAILIGGLSITVFDPIREFFIKSKVSGTFQLDEYRLIRWVKRETIGRLGFTKTEVQSTGTGIEAEREEAKARLAQWIADQPDGFITVTGPTGSGKTDVVNAAVRNRKNVLTLNCDALAKASKDSEAHLVSELANQTGYFPQFTFFSQINKLIDVASMGLIGQKAGFSTTLEEQMKGVLDLTTAALKDLSEQAKRLQREAAAQAIEMKESETERLQFVAAAREGDLHDGRMDFLAGNGIMSELGMGMERCFSEKGDWTIMGPSMANRVKSAISETPSSDATADIDQLPLVIIKRFGSNHKQDQLWQTLADWAAVLVENQIAHVVIASDSVNAIKPLSKALPSKPLQAITLTDASSENALQYVSTKLTEYLGPDATLSDTHSQQSVTKLGGRLTDLEILVQKVRTGIEVPEAVQEIVARSATEVKKAAFGDDFEEVKGLPWTREQAWYIVKALSSQEEVRYVDVLMNSPFKGNEKALRALEESEIISIHHRPGHASNLVRAGKPVYRSAFMDIVNDRVFAASMELAINAAAQVAAETTIKTQSEELIKLSQLFTNGKWVVGGTNAIPVEISARVESALQKMRTAQESLKSLDEQVGKLKKQLEDA